MTQKNIKGAYASDTLLAEYRGLHSLVSDMIEDGDLVGMDIDRYADLCTRMTTLVAIDQIPRELDACPDCGCTDVEASAWIHSNTGIDTGDDGPTDGMYCPQCGDWGLEGHFKPRHLVRVEVECPYDGDREIPESVANFPAGATI